MKQSSFAVAGHAFIPTAEPAAGSVFGWILDEA
jgi:hypothetical protein